MELVADRHRLIELARGPSADARVALLRSISDLFFKAEAERTPAEILLFEEIATRVVREIDPRERALYSEGIADQRTAPHGLVMTLAADDVQIAQPVLERSLVFSDQDLIAIASTSGEEHLRAISRRATLADVVTDILVHRGSEIVLRSVARNHGAAFSLAGFEELIRRCRDDEDLQRGLSERRDLPGPTIEALSNVLTDRLRVQLVARGYDDPDALAPELLTRLRNSLSVAVEDRGRDMQTLDHLVQEIRAERVSMKRVIHALARGDRAHDLATLLAALAHVDLATVVHVLTGPTEEPIIVLLRALNAPWDAFEAVLQMRARQCRQPYGRSPVLAQTYAEMDSVTAERVLRFIEMRRAGSGAGEDVGFGPMREAFRRTN